MSTENGVWIFFRNALKNKTPYNTVFIYSDMQAGHGGLYGTTPDEYNKFLWNNGRNIDVLALLKAYRSRVNPKLNFFSVQVAGYDNSVVPEQIYRGGLLAGWTGKEVPMAHELIKLWDEYDNQVENVQANEPNEPNELEVRTGFGENGVEILE